MNAETTPRVMTVVADLGIGGTQRCAQNYAIALKRNGVRSSVYAFRHGGARELNLHEAGVPVIAGDLRAALNWNPEVVHIHRPGLRDRATQQIISAFADRGATVVETNVFGKPDFSEASQQIAVHMQLSEWSLWKWQRRTANLRPRPIGIVFPYAIDPEVFTPIEENERARTRASLGVPEDAIVLGRVGQPLDAKWNVDLVRAFKEVARRNDRIYLALVGAPPKVMRSIARLDSELRRRVVCIQRLESDDALRRVYGCLDSFVHSSKIGESFGMVILEALLCGIPVITRTRLARDNTQALIVDHRVNGLLVASTSGMIRAIDEMIQDGAAFRSRTIRCREGLVRQFSMATIGARLAELATAAKTLDVSSFRAWCVEHYVSQPDTSEMFRRVTSAYGYRHGSVRAASLAHSAALYRLLLLVKHRGSANPMPLGGARV